MGDVKKGEYEGDVEVIETECRSIDSFEAESNDA